MGEELQGNGQATKRARLRSESAMMKLVYGRAGGRGGGRGS